MTRPWWDTTDSERWQVYRSTYLFREDTETVWIAKRKDGGESRPFSTWRDAFNWADHRVRERAEQAVKRYNLEKHIAQGKRDSTHNHCKDCRCC